MAHTIPGVQVPNHVAAATSETVLSAEEVTRITDSVRPPRKWADPDRTILTPQWRVWNEARKQRADDDQRAFLRSGFTPSSADWANEAIYFPEDYDRVLGEDGDWVLVIDPPQAVALDFTVPILSMWFARPHVLNAGRFAGRAPYQAVIQTPAGDLHLWPHEYVIASAPEALMGEEGVQIHALGGDPLLDEEQLFYLLSRGVPRRDAIVMLFGQIRQPNYCYVTFPEEVVDMFAGVGTRPGSTLRPSTRSTTVPA